MTDTSSSLIAPFGRTAEGRQASIYLLQNEHLRVRITDFGGRIVSIEAPDRTGHRQHIVLGFESVADYVAAGQAFGALLGRDANRIANGRFILDGHIYELSKNEGDSTLHGGARGFDHVFWRVEASTASELVLEYISPDGDQGFPGRLSVRAAYRLIGNALELVLEAETTKPTPVSLSAHPYFNLAGLPAGDILDHEITIEADRFLPTDARQIPTGEIRPVEGTAFDFRRPVRIAEHIRRPDIQLLYGRGHDHYFVLRQDGQGAARRVARAHHRQSGRVLEIFTTQPGLQFYTGNNLNGSILGRDGAYRQSAGLAFEPQGFPDAANQLHFPTTILQPQAHYREVIRYEFTTE
jgi:aldose 1-epimerase